MKVAHALAGLAVTAALACGDASAAPIRPFEPADICGEVVSSNWHPARSVAGRPGFSGSLGRDRSFPARFGVVLKRSRGLDPASIQWVNGVLGGAAGNPSVSPGELILLINSDDPRLLEGARTLCVYRFGIRGDEGGTWTSHDRLEIKP